MHYLRGILLGLSLWVLPCVGGAADARAADTILLKTGERLIGELLSEAGDDPVRIDSRALGALDIPRSAVARVERTNATEPPESANQASAGPIVATDSAVEAAKKAAPEAVQAGAAPRTEVASAGGETVDEPDSGPGLLERIEALKAPKSWSGNVRVGVNLSRGDRRWQQTYARGNLVVRPEKSPSQYRFSGSYTYRENERPNGRTFKATDKYDGTFTYRRPFSERWFFQNALGGRVDQIKGIDYEIQEVLGLGYSFKPAKTLEFVVGAGGGGEYLEANFEPGTSGSVEPVMNVFQEFRWKPIERTSFSQEFSYYWSPDEASAYNYVIKTAFRIRLTDLFGLEFSFNQEFDNDTGPGEVEEDSQWRNALVVYF